MSYFWGDMAGDGLANNERIYTKPPGRAGESFNRLSADGLFTLVTATTYFTTVFYERGQLVTNIGYYIGVAAATPTSQWVGLWTHPNAPTVKTQTQGNVGPIAARPIFTSQWTATRTSGSPTFTIAPTGVYDPVSWPMSLAGRSLTGTGTPASGWVRSQTGTTITASGNATNSTPGLINVLQFMSGKYNIGFSTNGTTTAMPIGAYSRALSPGPVVIAATGLYMHSITVAATTMPQLVCKNPAAAIPVGFYNDVPAWSQSHVNATTNNTAPGTNPVSGGTSADLRTILYTYST